ncbi:MAG: OmpA family protein [Planktomarina sp.]
MAHKNKMVSAIATACLGAAVLMAGATASVAHQTTGDPFPHVHGKQRKIVGQRFVPTIWIDPDGCEHWVMDDGWEGYMTPKLDRNGIPTCHGRTAKMCGVMDSDTLFTTDSAHLSKKARWKLQKFFQQNPSAGYIIRGHTDSRASDQYNVRLSQRRAQAVARVGQQSGARIAGVEGYGERKPIATNATKRGMARNRRVEIICVN